MLQAFFHRGRSVSARAAVGVLLSLGLVGLALAPLRAAEPDLKSLKEAEQRSIAVAERIRAATVGIINQSLSAHGAGMGEGSGVVVSEDGLILTVGHVLGKNGSELTVVFPDGRRAQAKSLGADFTRDAGMARITDPGKWPHVEVGKSADLKPGQWCLAIGHPGGIQQGRTPPLRLGRILATPGPNSPMPFLQTDATVISGDSGGPLFDLDGKVIGIHSNIGLGVTENRHVPVDVHREKWQDLLAGKQTGEMLGSHARNPFDGAMPDFAKFSRMLQEQLKAGNPEVKALVKGGHVMLTPERMTELMAKWEKQGAADKGASTAAAIDFLRFQRLFQERLVAGDAEVRGLIHEGHMPLTMEQMQDLLKKWEQPPGVAAAPAASPGVALMPDIQKFQHLLKERLQAGDPEVLGMVAGGTLQLTPEKMHALIEKWEKKSATAKSTEAKPAEVAKGAPPPNVQLPEGAKGLAELLKHAKSNGNGSYELHVTPENAKEVMGLLKGHGLAGLLAAGGGAPKIGKADEKLRAVLAPVAKTAAGSTVAVLCDGKPTLLGTVVRKDGCILTKASDLKGTLTCKIGTRELPATVVKTRADNDLALLKVNANDLVPIQWAKENPLPLGTWLLAADNDGKPMGLGILGIPTRPIPKNPTMILRNRAALGALLDAKASDARIEALSPGGPADKSGMKAGDVITAVDGQNTPTAASVIDIMRNHAPGDTLHLDVHRGKETLKFSAVVIPSEKLAATGVSSEKVAALSRFGGSLSTRKSDFPSAFTHDIVLEAAQCGGPVLNLDGQAVGLNIARVDRTATYAIPVASLQAVIADLLAAVK